MKYKVGDKVRIVSNRTQTMASNGSMDKYLGTVMTIAKAFRGTYEMQEDSNFWTWYNHDIKSLVSENKTMTLSELNQRGLKQGDLYYIEHEVSDFTGWYLVISDSQSISLNTKRQGAFGGALVECDYYKLKKVIFIEDLSNNKFISNTSTFFKTFKETLVEKIITNIIDVRMAKYVQAVHFGSSKLYTWRVPERLEKVQFKDGDIIEVDTCKGSQFVEVRTVKEYEYNDNTKEVLGFVKSSTTSF